MDLLAEEDSVIGQVWAKTILTTVRDEHYSRCHAGADLEEPARAETPDPEDRRFQDDDGTWYIWDALLRKFVEEVINLDP